MHVRTPRMTNGNRSGKARNRETENNGPFSANSSTRFLRQGTRLCRYARQSHPAICKLGGCQPSAQPYSSSPPHSSWRVPTQSHSRRPWTTRRMSRCVRGRFCLGIRWIFELCGPSRPPRARPESLACSPDTNHTVPPWRSASRYGRIRMRRIRWAATSSRRGLACPDTGGFA